MSISINNSKVSKRNKGISLIEIPSSFTVIDIETTGFDANYDNIIEIAAIKVNNNKIIDTYQSLIKLPKYSSLDEFIEDLTGIINEMLQTAPSLKDILPQYLQFIGDDILVGHNVNFDINFLYDVIYKHLNKEFNNDFVDLMRLSRKLYPTLINHKLSTIADFFNIDTSNNHRALADCEITLNCFSMLSQHVQNNNINLKSLFTKKCRPRIDLSTIEATTDDFDENHPLFNMNCTFTGKLEKIERKEAAQLVINLGGKCLNNLTKKTIFLILGNFDYSSSIKDGKSSKLKKAEKYILDGQDIQIISENVFYDLVDDK